jgi:hypothetical protein
MITVQIRALFRRRLDEMTNGLFARQSPEKDVKVNKKAGEIG